MLILLFSLLASAAPPDWESLLDRVIPGVVSIRVTATRSFDTETARSSVATGFVVDAERGIILTNRHVVNPGPVVAEAVFSDHEEVPLVPLYRDPIHDFGFFQYDPGAVRYIKPVALPLDPEAARVGVELRVVGNDAGEKISILAGTLARLDRDAPNYGNGAYNDFNTFYLQAASGTSGGSSGSPVLDAQGRVIALNAGSKRDAASSYFLPLQRVVRALAAIQAGQPVARGTLQAVFRYRPYDEVRRLGVRPETEAAFRAAFPEGTGMLTVSEIVPGGPAWQALKPGDVLTAVDGQPVGAFIPLEAALDEHVGATLSLGIERGGVPMTLALEVDDLHAVTPRAYVEFSGGVVHGLSFQIARAYSQPVGAVYVAAAGYALGDANLGRGTVIESVDGKPTPDLEHFEAVVSALPDGVRVPVRSHLVNNPRLSSVSVLTIDRRWFDMKRCERDDRTGSWPCRASPAPPTDSGPLPVTAAWPRTDAGPGRRLARSLVGVEYNIPYTAEGVYGTEFRGTGVVVDAERGLVVVDRDTVPISLGDATLTFAGQVAIPGRVVYIHPEHNLAVLGYDPALLGETPVRAAVLRASDPLDGGDRVWQVGLESTLRLIARRTRVERVIPPRTGLPSPPFFRESNVSLAQLTDASPTMGGVLADRRGRVRALWASYVDLSTKERQSFLFGLPAALLEDVVAPLRTGELPVWQSLGVELGRIPLIDAVSRGLPPDLRAALSAHDRRDAEALVIRQVAPETPAMDILRIGDLLVSVNGAPVTRPREVEQAAQQGALQLQVVRDGAVVNVELPTVSLGSDGPTEILQWAGALLHATPRAARNQRNISDEGVYVAAVSAGSPASRYGLQPTLRVVAVDGEATPSLDRFRAAVAKRGDRSPVRLAVLDLDDKPDMLTLKLDLTYWPSQILSREDGSWTREAAEGADPAEPR